MGKVIIRRMGSSEFVEGALNIFLDPRAELTKEQALRLIATLEKEYGIEISWETLISSKSTPGLPNYDPIARIVVRSYKFKAEEIPEDEFFRTYGTLDNAEKELKMKGYIIERIES